MDYGIGVAVTNFNVPTIVISSDVDNAIIAMDKLESARNTRSHLTGSGRNCIHDDSQGPSIQ